MDASRPIALAIGVFACIGTLAGEFVAPPLQLPAPARKLSTATSVFVRAFQFEGNRAFSSADLAKFVAPYVGREVTNLELEDARRAVTLAYVNRGYINSGAVFPEQDVRAGVIRLRITEGELSDLTVRGPHWLRESYIRDRLLRHAGPPLNMNALKDGLELLRQNPNVTQVNAELRPGAQPGEGLLDVRVTDRQPFRVALQVDDYRPPSVGGEEILLLLGDRNLTGHSDPFELAYGIAEGGQHGFKFSDFDNVSAAYTVPLTASDTTLRVYGNKNNFAVVEEPFNALNIESQSYRLGATLRQPVYQTPNRELALALTFERRRTKSFLLGQPFDISPGTTNGVTEISALRVSQEWIDRSQDQVLALRSTFSVGLDAFGVTDIHTNRNAKFFSWLGQGQYARRLFQTANQLILRTDVQLTDRPLLSLEQFTLGGASSVRGYRENQLVRDQGVLCSAELRLPVVFDRRGAAVVQLAPFFDFGGGWNNDSPTPAPRTISSAGIGILITPNPHLNAQLYWGHPFKKIENPSTDPQDLGLHFRVTCEAF